MPLGPPTRTVGARLREAREKRGVSLRQISNSTRISVMSLEALERSDLSRLPGGIFTRAFIRAYAQEVGSNPDRTIEDFIAELPAEAVTANVRSLTIEDGEKLESDRLAFVTAARLVLMSLPLMALAIYYGNNRTSTDDSYGASAPVDAMQETAGTEAVRSVPDVQPAPQISSLTLEVAPKGACWVAVTADGSLVFSGLMEAGDTRVVRATKEILLNIGDAGTFAYMLNGRRGRSLGSSGQVVSHRITISNLSEFVLP